MTSLRELRSPIDLITPLGKAVAHFIYDGGPDGTEWGCFQCETGEFWRWPNRMVRLRTSISNYRVRQSEIFESEAMKAALASHRARYKQTANSKQQEKPHGEG